MLCSDPSRGLGKPEPLKHTLSGLWSKRISQKDRLIYKFDEKYIYIFAIGLKTNVKASPYRKLLCNCLVFINYTASTPQ